MKKYMVDARGKQCPIPVVETKKMLAQMAESDIVETLVDNAIAVQNLEKMAKQKQLECSWEQQDEHTYRVFIKAEGAVDEAGEETAECIPCQPVSEKTGNTIVVLSSDCMGEGDEVLGRALMKGFIYALTSQEELPDTVIMYNRGARLPVEGSESLEDLKLLESQGVEILTCGTCLNHYGLTEKLSNPESHNAQMIKEGKKKEERFKILQEIAEYQLNVLNTAEKIKMLEDENQLVEI